MTKKILLCVYHFIANDIAQYFKESGYEVELMGYYENNDYSKVWRHDPQTVLEQIAKKPDLFFTLNSQHLDPSGRTARLLKSLKIPVINWYLDNPFSSISPWYINNKSIKPYKNIQLWCIDKNQSQKLAQMGYDSKYVPHITTSIFFNNKPQLTKINVSFIGNLGFSLKDKFRGFLGNNHQILQWTEDFINSFMDSDSRDFESFLLNFKKPPAPFTFNRSTQEGIIQCDFLKFIASAHTRQDLIKYLPTDNLKIYGDEDWLDLISPDNFGGRINYQNQTPLTYSQTAINLNITHLQFENAFNQRILDVLAGGNFLLTDYTPALNDYFEVGRDIICYKKRSEIPALIRYYLDNPDERKEIALRGKKIVREHFDIKQTLDRLIP